MPQLCRAVLLTVCAVLCAHHAAAADEDVALPGTAAVQVPADIYDRQYKQLEDAFLKRIAESDRVRTARWHRDFTSAKRYAASVEPNRATVATLIGAGGRETAGIAPEVRPLANAPGVHHVEFQVYYDVRVDGLLMMPAGDGPFPVVIACHPDAGSPEALCGEAAEQRARWAQTLVSKGFAVIAPRFLPRVTDHPDAAAYAKDLRHVIHRMSYVVGKHPIGVDVDTVSAAIDALPALGRGKLDASRVGVFGTDQGGLTAMYAAALDSRIDTAVLVDSFDDRSRAYDEPADRAIFRQLVEFDDSDVCSLIAPRPLCVVARDGDGVSREFAAVREVYQSLSPANARESVQLVTNDPEALTAVDWLARSLNASSREHRPPLTKTPLRPAAETTAKRDKLYAQLKAHFDALIEQSDAVRAKRWASDARSPEHWQQQRLPQMREAYLNLVGRWDNVKRTPLNPRSQKAYDTEDYVGYKVLLDVFDGIEAYGVLLVPKGVPAGERRPVVICQHGFAGNPEKTIGPGDVDQYYRRFPHNLARRGYVAFAPYIVVPTEESEWRLDRRSKILGESRVSVCVHKYAAIVDFLRQLPFVQPNRIGFQGLSFGGYTGLWVVSQEPRISPVVVAGYFSDWKARLFDDAKGYMPIRSEEMYSWDILNSFNHSDLAAMICPRPVFVEHGIDHGPNWMIWSGAEYEHVESLYAQLGIVDRQRFYPFPGGHETGTEVAFQFLDKWLAFTPKRAPTGVVFADTP